MIREAWSQLTTNQILHVVAYTDNVQGTCGWNLLFDISIICRSKTVISKFGRIFFAWLWRSVKPADGCIGAKEWQIVKHSRGKRLKSLLPDETSLETHIKRQ